MCITAARAQYIFKPGILPKSISILEYALIADAGTKNFSAQDVRDKNADLKFKPLTGKLGKLGFTHHNYWMKFDISNDSDVPVFYYLQTAEPVTDNVNLYLYDVNGKASTQESGDNTYFEDRPLPYRETLFKIDLQPGEKKQALIALKNDGEKNSLPLLLISQEELLKNIYNEQLVMGIFYGILFVIAITYFFFYFGLRDRSFLYYSLYVSAVGLCQLALDGLFHQYIDQDPSWLNLHAVIIFAILGSYFFGKYSELILDIRKNNPVMHKAFQVLYLLLWLVLAGVVLVPAFLKYSYPLVNILTLLGMLMIFLSIIIIIYKKQPLDLFYTSGIIILFLCFTVAILLNFGFLPESLSMDNITKPGIGLEIIALSLSMSNRIGLLKSKKEELQTFALQRSQEMNNVKSYFLSNMSHELRTPLNAILGLTNIMGEETSDPKLKAYCETIKYASHGLISSVNDILDFSKIEKGQLKLDNIEFKPAQVMDKVRTALLTQAENKGLSFEFNTNLTDRVSVIGDPIRLEQMLNNILSNAIKFTAKGGVTFSVDASTEAEQFELRLTVSDTGLGIEKEKLDSVFGVFSQVDLDTKRKFGGFGIGLSVVKALVDLHKGKIRLNSEVDKGTTCIIELRYPLASIMQEFRNSYPVDSYDLLNKHILVVEDNQMNQMVIRMMLKQWQNTTVSFANDGAEGLDALQNNQIDLILMDLQMPVMDGYEATSAIRGGKAGIEHINIPIIVLTADVMDATKERVFELGVDDYMTKPLDQKLLYQKVTALLST